MSKKWSKLFLLTACTAGACALYQYYKKKNATSIIDENSKGSKTDCEEAGEKDIPFTSHEKSFEQPAKRGYVHIPLHRN